LKPQFITRDAVRPGRIETAMEILAEGKRKGNCVIAYSGGKDGLAAALLAKDAGISLGVCELSFTFAKQEWDIRLTAQRLGFTMIWRNSLSLSWLAQRPQYVFNHDRKRTNELMQFRQRNSVERFAKHNHIPVVITGRKSQGNTVASAVHKRGNGTWGCHPLRSWDEADVWTFLRDRGVATPWVYQTPIGISQGNTGWPFCRECPDIQGNWRVIHDIEPSVVEAAALVDVVGARDFLRTV
jgi:3'-phosphoadenosine 5'-phosphosulfate sulfotransferase (PAPS reductase)/FAD synthetase